MLAAIGTVLFWGAAIVLAYFVLALALLILGAILGPILDRAHNPKPSHPLLAQMTPEERYQWANRIGPYADT